MTPTSVNRWKLVAAFAAVYLIWGSTYLAIRFAIETVPPFLMAGTRFLVAGTLLYGWMRLRGTPAPTRLQWRWAALLGLLFLFGGNGLVVWAEQLVPSGIAALLVAAVPVWTALLDWLRPGGERLGLRGIVGLVIGIVGVATLVAPGQMAGGEAVNALGAAALMVATISWSFGSVLSRRATLPQSPLLGTGMEMLAGGAALVLLGLGLGEAGRVDLAALSLRSALALGYLIVFGSLVAFSAFVWLLRVTEPTRVATYAYVNPVVAVLLGWAFAGEPLTLRTLLAAAVIVAAVVLITTSRGRRNAPAAAAPAEAKAGGSKARGLADAA